MSRSSSTLTTAQITAGNASSKIWIWKKNLKGYWPRKKAIWGKKAWKPHWRNKAIVLSEDRSFENLSLLYSPVKEETTGRDHSFLVKTVMEILVPFLSYFSATFNNLIYSERFWRHKVFEAVNRKLGRNPNIFKAITWISLLKSRHRRIILVHYSVACCEYSYANSRFPLSVNLAVRQYLK